MKKTPTGCFPSSSGNIADNKNSWDKIGEERNFSHGTVSIGSKLAFLCFFLVFCSCVDVQNDNVPSSHPDKDTLNFDVSVPLSTLNPYEAQYSGSSYVFPLLYSYLAVPDANGDLQKDLAESWSYDREKFVWTIRLKKNVRFHDGNLLTSADVVCYFESNLSPAVGALSENIDYVKTVSQFSVEIGLKRDDPEFLKKNWDAEIIQVPSRKTIDYYNNPIGSGAFKFGHRDGNKHICLVRNPDYHDTPPSIEKVCFHYEPDKEKTWARLLSGHTDAATDISPENINIMTKYGDRFHFNHYTLNHFSLVLYNTKIDLFSTPKIRIALTLAINRDYIVKEILKGYGQVATGPLGINCPLCDPNALPEIVFNPRKALSMLEEEGWRLDERGYLAGEKRTSFEFTLSFASENDIDKEVAEYIQMALNDIGIKVHLEKVSGLELLKRYRHNDKFQAVLAEMANTYRQPEILMYAWVSETNRCSDMGCFENSVITGAIKSFLNEKHIHEKKRGAGLVKAFQEIQPATFLFHKSALDVISKRIDYSSPFSLNVEGGYRLKYALIEKE